MLARELLDLLALCPGATAVDCTFGGGGHARLVAQRLGPTGTLIAIDRDPLAEARFVELAAELTCKVRFIRGGYAAGLAMLEQEGVQADAVYFDLGMSSMQVDTRERGFSYSSTPRSTCAWTRARSAARRRSWRASTSAG